MIRGDSIFTWDKFNDNEDIRKQAMQSASAGGPNSGFEIPDVDYFKQPELANEFPEMKDDINLIVSTEAYIHRLVDFHQRMLSAKGMSRGMAYELLELVPDMESYVKPNGFTEDITGVGFKPSLESISTQMWIVIAAAIAFLVGLIYKFISWMFGGDSSGGGGTGDLSKAKEGIRESEKKLDEQDRIVDKTLRTIQEAKGKHIEMNIPGSVNKQEIENSRIPDVLKKEILDNTDELKGGIDPVPSRTHHLKIDLFEVLTKIEGGQDVYRYMRRPSKYARLVYGMGNEAIRLVMASFDGFAEASSIVSQQLSMLEDLLKNTDELGHGKDLHEEMAARGSFKTIEEVVLDKTTLKFDGFEFDSIAHWAQKLKDLISEYGSQEPNYNDLEELLVGYHRGLRRMKEVRFARLAILIDLLQSGEPTLKKLEQMAKQNASAGKILDQKAAEHRAQSIMRIHRALSINYTGLMKIYSELSRVYSEVSKHGWEVVDTLRKNAAEIIHAYNRFGEMIPPAMEELGEELIEQTKEMETHTVRPHLLPSQWVTADRVRISFSADGEEPNEHNSMEVSSASAADLKKLITGEKE